MKCAEIKCNHLSYNTIPNIVNEIIELCEINDVSLNINKLILEKLWFVFSHKNGKSFLAPCKENYEKFIRWISAIDIDVIDGLFEADKNCQNELNKT